MKIAQRKLLIAVLALFCSASYAANDPPKAEPPKDAKAADNKDEKKDGKDGKDGKDAKAEAPAVPDLPSKPYPSNATPKAFQPKKDAAPKADAGQEKPADKAAEKPADKGGDKAAAKPGTDKAADKHAAEKPADKSADAHATVAPKQENTPNKAVKKHRNGHNTQAKTTPAPTPAMIELAREVAAQQKNAGAQSYVVRARDNLDSVIRKTMPANLFAADVLRQAFLRANPALVTATNVKLRPGQVLQVPDVATIRAVVMSESGNSNGSDSKISLHSTAPVVSPTVAATANDLNPPIAIPRLPVNVAGSANPAPEVSPEEKKKWVRYP
jgi:hypothetical protein